MAKRKMSTFERLTTGEMNRKQRRELGRKVAAGNPELMIVNANAGGVDVGNERHFASVPPDRDPNPVRERRLFSACARVSPKEPAVVVFQTLSPMDEESSKSRAAYRARSEVPHSSVSPRPW
jgi:hypothetical protein